MRDASLGHELADVRVAELIAFRGATVGRGGPHRPDDPRHGAFRSLLVVVRAGAGIYFGADWTVAGLRGIAIALGLSNAIVAVTLLALGTTLPEPAVSIADARSGKAALAVGNILGSCIFNALVVVGAAGVLGGVSVPVDLTGFALPFAVASAVLVYLLVQDRRISNWEGALFIVIYGLFIAKISGFS